MVKKAFRFFCCVCLTTIFAAAPLTVLAQSEAVLTFTGTSEFTASSEDQWTSTDLFGGMKDLMPGDIAEETIKVRNTSPEYDSVNLYIRAAEHNEKDNPLSEAVAKNETVASMTDFLSKLHMTLQLEDKVVFSDTPDKAGSMTENILIGQLKNDQEKELKVTISVPSDIGDEYQNRAGEVDWIITAECIRNGANETSAPEKQQPADGKTDEKAGTSAVTSNAKTGDMMTGKLFAYSACVIAVIPGLFYAAGRRKRDKK